MASVVSWPVMPMTVAENSCCAVGTAFYTAAINLRRAEASEYPPSFLRRPAVFPTTLFLRSGVGTNEKSLSENLNIDMREFRYFMWICKVPAVFRIREKSSLIQ